MVGVADGGIAQDAQLGGGEGARDGGGGAPEDGRDRPHQGKRRDDVQKWADHDAGPEERLGETKYRRHGQGKG